MHKIDVLKNMDELNNSRRFEQGDVVCIRIPESKRDGMQQVVATTGEIQAPYVGLIKAEGRTCKELAFKIKSEIKKLEKSYPVDFKTSPPVGKNFFADATVLVAFDGIINNERCVLRELPFVVAFGSVAKQGKYDLEGIPNHKLSGLINRAGGLTSKAAIPKICVIRKTAQDSKTIVIDSKALLNKKPEADLVLQESDVVVVD